MKKSAAQLIVDEASHHHSIEAKVIDALNPGVYWVSIDNHRDGSSTVITGKRYWDDYRERLVGAIANTRR